MFQTQFFSNSRNNLFCWEKGFFLIINLVKLVKLMDLQLQFRYVQCCDCQILRTRNDELIRSSKWPVSVLHSNMIWDVAIKLSSSRKIAAYDGKNAIFSPFFANLVKDCVDDDRFVSWFKMIYYPNFRKPWNCQIASLLI